MTPLFLRWSNGTSFALPFEYDGRPSQLIEKLSEFRAANQTGVAELSVAIPGGYVWSLPGGTFHIVSVIDRPSDPPDANPKARIMKLGWQADPVLYIGPDSAQGLLESVIARCRESARVWRSADPDERFRSWVFRDSLAVLRDDLRRNISMALDEDLLPDDPKQLFEFAVEAHLQRDFHRAYPRVAQ